VETSRKKKRRRQKRRHPAGKDDALLFGFHRGQDVPGRRVEGVRRITWKSNHSNPTVFNFGLFVADFKMLESLFSLKSLHRSDWTAVDVDDASRERFTFRQRGITAA